MAPFRHDAFVAQELVDPDFARAARRLATAEGAALVLDEVRTGLRLDVRGAWESLGVRPDLTAFSKALANGYPIAALVGVDALSAAASEVYVTGSFWYSAVPMAAGLATVREAVALDAPALTRSAGARFKAGLQAQSVAAGMPLELTGPEQMPLLVFADDVHKKRAFAFTDAAIRHGVLLHPWHNMFLSTAHTDDVVDDALRRTQDAFDELEHPRRLTRSAPPPTRLGRGDPMSSARSSAPHRFRRSARRAGIALVAATALTACSSTGPATTDRSGIIIGRAMDVNSLDISRSLCDTCQIYNSAVYETVVRATPDGELEPLLAESGRSTRTPPSSPSPSTRTPCSPTAPRSRPPTSPGPGCGCRTCRACPATSCRASPAWRPPTTGPWW